MIPVIIAFLIYLFILSIVDIKKRELQYWQTGLVYVFSLAGTICLIIQSEKLMLSIILHLTGFLAVFALMLGFSLVKTKNGKFAFGGADIWVASALGLVFGILDIWGVLIVTFVSYLLYAIVHRLVKKTKAEHTAFVPFLTIGAVYGVIPLLI